jgi:hypothetical protein
MVALELAWLGILLLVVCLSASRAETYGNFNTMGVVADCPEGYGPLDIGHIKAYLVTGEERRELHDFVRVACAVEPKDYFATSIFHLEPDAEYAVDVEYYDTRGRLIESLRETGRTRPEPHIPETARSLYVSPDGNDDDPGTAERPLGTLAAAFADLTPGTTLYLRGGTYYEGALVVPSGGTREAPIVIRSCGEQKPIIDCSLPELTDTDWEHDGQGIYSTALDAMSWNICLEDRRTGKHYRSYPLRTRRELADRQSAGMSFERLGFTGAYHHDGELLHLRLPEGTIDDYRVHVSRHDHAIVADGCDHVFIDGIEIRSTTHGAISMNDSSEWLIQHLRVLYCNEGVHIKGDSSNNTIQDSYFFDDVNHWDFEYVKTDAGWLYHGYVETGAVATDGRYSGRGLVFRRNHVEGLFDGVHLSPWVECNVRTSETDFHDNKLLAIADDFIETDGYSRNVRIFRNYMSEALTGVSLAQALDGPTWVLFNVIANCGVCSGTQLGGTWGYPIKLNGGDGYLDMGTGTVLLYHNTSCTQDPDGRAFLVKHAMWRGLVFRNNIWCGRIAGLVSFLPQIWPVDWDYDVIYRESGPLADMGNRQYDTLEDLRAARPIMPIPRHGPSGLGSHLITDDPRFLDAPTGDFRLRDDSPCRDAGVVIAGINDGTFHGAAPDMGAIQHGEAPIG